MSTAGRKRVLMFKQRGGGRTTDKVCGLWFTQRESVGKGVEKRGAASC